MTTLAPSPIPASIAPLLRRHAEDASFYWAQHDVVLASTSGGQAALVRFSHLLLAHLEGLAVGRPDALPYCLAGLERWNSPASCRTISWTVAHHIDVDLPKFAGALA